MEPHDPDSLAQARYARMLWNAPLSPEHAALLLGVLDLRGCRTVVDLGCGWGELLMRAVAAGTAGQTRGIGVDTDEALLRRARTLASERGLDDRVHFAAVPAADWTGTADRAICVGAAHAFGGADAALRMLSAIVRPGGRLLFGDGIWDRPPTAEAREMFGEEVQTLPEAVRTATDAGWRVLHLSTTDQREWDVFESSWRQGRQEWLLAHPDDKRAGQVRDELDRQQRDYLQVYRGVLGFAYLVLGR